MRGSVGLTTVSQQHNLSPRCLLRNMSSIHRSCSGKFSLSEFSLPLIHYVVCWHLLQCFLSAFRFPCDHLFTNGDSIIGVCATATLQSIPLPAYVPPGYGSLPIQGVYWVAVPSNALSRRSYMLLTQLSPQPFYQYGKPYSFGNSVERHLIPLPSHHGRGVIFSRFCSTQ